ncbi:hypothetical protein BD289DRAFT_37159 [Coniella lustricola]|uniref:Uncharacterized protein n=1 Tax=Coniella lustricola TaxID=2025994 RepID=A0A2T3AIP2_9PEZI|nr:hypothetical protein BD289DRAFT_37159 [Coniella lustricola]
MALANVAKAGPRSFPSQHMHTFTFHRPHSKTACPPRHALTKLKMFCLWPRGAVRTFPFARLSPGRQTVSRDRVSRADDSGPGLGIMTRLAQGFARIFFSKQKPPIDHESRVQHAPTAPASCRNSVPITSHHESQKVSKASKREENTHQTGLPNTWLSCQSGMKRPLSLAWPSHLTRWHAQFDFSMPRQDETRRGQHLTRPDPTRPYQTLGDGQHVCKILYSIARGFATAIKTRGPASSSSPTTQHSTIKAQRPRTG